jgi:cell division protein FtsQ
MEHAMSEVSSLEVERLRAGFFRRRRNRRLSYRTRSPLLWLADGLERLWHSGARVARLAGKVLLVAAAVALCLWGARLGMRHVVDSPRFRLQTIEFAATPHLRQSEVLALADVAVGDRLLAIDTDTVAARIAGHPWVKSVQVSRRLPGALVIQASERQAAAAAALDGLYLVDESGRPFKRASMEEADGLPVLTGIERRQYGQMPEVSQAAFREALGVLAEYRSRSGRPPVGEVSIDPGFGFSLLLFDGGAEIRLGRGNYRKKLAQLDRILEALVAKGSVAALRIVHLDLPESGRVPVLLGNGTDPFAPPNRKLAKN